MQPLRVYGMCDNERVAETLAVLVEPDYEFHWLTPLRGDPGSWPRPALVVDARRRRSPREPSPARWWPGVRSVRLELADTFNPAAAQREIADALRAPGSAEGLRLTVAGALHAIAAELKPRLTAVRIVVTTAQHFPEPDISSWRDLLRHQMRGLADAVKRLGLAGNE